MVEGLTTWGVVCFNIYILKGGQPININKFNIFSNDFDCESTAVQFFMAFVIIPVGVGLPIAIASPVITMIGDGLIGGVAQSAGYVQEK